MRTIITGLMLFATLAHAQTDLGKTKLGDALGTQTPTTQPAAAQPATVAGVGNLPPDFYPKSPCIKPDAASIGRKPGDARDVKAVDAYNQQIAAYNKIAETYNSCVKAYAAKAQVDLARIQAAIRAANAN